MLVIWRGFGWAVPVIAFLAFLLFQVSLDAIYGDGYYKSNEWTDTAAIITGSILIGILGYILNYRKRVVVIDDETGKKQKSASHALFFIPIEYWAILVPLLFFWMEGITEELDAKYLSYIESPAVNDMYSVDFTKIFESTDDEYKYGVMKVVSISPAGVEVVVSDFSYDKKAGVRKDLKKAKTSGADYFSEDSVGFRKDELLDLLSADAIYSVSRN